ncbi:MAG: M48 family metallopeptidase [Bacteroidales bacterium]
MLKNFHDPELGIISIKPHKTARRFIFRATTEGIQITCPPHVSMKQVTAAFEQQRHLLPRLRKRVSERVRLQKGTLLEMSLFRVSIQESAFGNMFEARYSKGVLEVVAPPATDYSRQEVQQFIEKNIVKVLRYEGAHYLPERTAELARKLGLSFRSCTVSYGKNRLGKCDTLRNIALSYRLMMLPLHLIDYVILHELTHLTEMNHGERFHALLNQYCGGVHRRLEKELKAFRFPI